MIIFKCQLCGNERGLLESDRKLGTVVCYDRDLCRATRELNEEFE